MKVELLELHVHAVKLNDLAIGEMGIVVSEHRKGHVILRTYNEFVDLNDPEQTWSDPVHEDNAVRVERREFKLVEIEHDW